MGYRVWSRKMRYCHACRTRRRHGRGSLLRRVRYHGCSHPSFRQNRDWLSEARECWIPNRAWKAIATTGLAQAEDGREVQREIMADATRSRAGLVRKLTESAESDRV